MPSYYLATRLPSLKKVNLYDICLASLQLLLDVLFPYDPIVHHHLHLLLPSGRHPEASHSDMRASSGQDQLTWWRSYQRWFISTHVQVGCRHTHTITKTYSFSSILFSPYAFFSCTDIENVILFKKKKKRKKGEVKKEDFFLSTLWWVFLSGSRSKLSGRTED